MDSNAKSVPMRVRERLVNSRPQNMDGINREFAGQAFASLFCCKACHSWWGVSKIDVPQKHLLWHLVEPYSSTYLWEDYRGWRQEADAGRCTGCSEDAGEADYVLRFNDQGEVIWPEGVNPPYDEPANKSRRNNPFLDYVSQSKKMDQNMAVIVAWEERHRSNAPGYTADIDELRCEMDKMRSAFKHVVYSYAPLLPPGWRVTGDYDKWIKGQACAGFLHGEIQPAVRLMIGGRCTTVAELELKLDHLFRYVCEMTC
jgi:hypothetical protein